MRRCTNKPNYCQSLQFAMMELYGKNWDGTAGLFTTNRFTANALKKAVRKIRNRLEQIITTDDRLRMRVADQIAALEANLKTFSNGHSNLLEITAELLTLIALLIGFDYYKGIPNRYLIYYQTKEQQETDNRFLEKNSPALDENSEYGERVKIASMLQRKGYAIIHIAKIMNRPKEHVRHWLRNAS